jgi:hypothetical protein
MGIFSTPYEGAKWIGSKSLEYTGKALYSPVAVAGWFRKKTSEILTKRPKAREGSMLDRGLLYPALVSAALVFGAGPIEKAEARHFAETRNTVRHTALDNANHANRISVASDIESIRSEKTLHERYGGEIDRELNIKAPEPSILERMAVRRLGELVNSTRPAGNQLNLLSTPHPISDICQKRAQFFSEKGIQDHPTPLNMLRNPTSDRKRLDKSGNVTYTKGGEGDKSWLKYIKKKKPRFDLDGEERRRALDAPVISDDGQTYNCHLSEKDEDYAGRARVSQTSRNTLRNIPLSVEVSLGDPEYPIGGNPFKLYEKLFAEYRSELTDLNWGQLSLSMIRKGKTITLTGFLTKDQVNVPETMPEPSLPTHFDDDWWYKKSEKKFDNEFCKHPDYKDERNLLQRFASDPGLLESEIGDLKKDDFTDKRNQTIFEQLLKCKEELEKEINSVFEKEDEDRKNKGIDDGLTDYDRNKKREIQRKNFIKSHMKMKLIHTLNKQKIVPKAGGYPYIIDLFKAATVFANYNTKVATEFLKRRKNMLYDHYNHPHFHSGVSIFAYVNLEAAIQRMNDNGFDIAISSTSIQPDEDLQSMRSDTLHIKLSINGQTEDLTLVKGTDLFKLADKSIFGESSEGEGSEERSFIHIDHLLERLIRLKDQKNISQKAIPLQATAKTP